MSSSILAQLLAAAAAQEKATTRPWVRNEISMPGYALLQRGDVAIWRSSQLESEDVDFIVAARDLPLAKLGRLVEVAQRCAASAVCIGRGESAVPTKLVDELERALAALEKEAHNG